MFSFACIEQPIRCFLSSAAHDRRLATTKEGEPFVTENRLGWEQWIVRPTTNHASFVLENATHRHFLSSNGDGTISTTTNQHCENAQWLLRIQPSSPTSLKEGYIIRSVAHGKNLTCNYGGHIHTSSDGNNITWCLWTMEFLTGELCFLSSAADHGKNIKCDQHGNLAMSHIKGGWEVWRLIPADRQGNILLSSWTHDNKYLCSNAEGHVYTTENHLGSWEQWTVEKDPHNTTAGIVVKSVSHGRVLQTDGNLIRTVPAAAVQGKGNCSLWCLDTACSQVFYISATCHDKRIGTSPQGNQPWTTHDRKEWEEWRIERRDDSFIFRSRHGTYLRSNPDGCVSVTHTVGEWEVWDLEESPHGGFFLSSRAHNRLLACDNNGHLYTVKDQHGGWETWRLEPCMPHTISGQQINRMALIGTSVAVSLGLMIAAPFAVMGVIGGLGFTQGGIAAGSAAAGMMSAEAIAAGGGVMAGGMVATLQSIGVVGLGVTGTTAAVAGGTVLGGAVIGTTVAATGGGRDCVGKLSNPSVANSDQRLGQSSVYKPFCEWRSW